MIKSRYFLTHTILNNEKRKKKKGQDQKAFNTDQHVEQF